MHLEWSLLPGDSIQALKYAEKTPKCEDEFGFAQGPDGGFSVSKYCDRTWQINRGTCIIDNK